MQKLYYEDQYIKDFTAEIEEVIEKDGKFHIVLDKTAFFPGGGGQLCDLGTIDVHNVIDVYEESKKIYHVVEKRPIKIHKVKCSIDWDRREDGMHQHFGQHILSGCFYSKCNANTVAVHFGKDISTVDIQGIVTQEQIREIEIYANDIIRQNIALEILTPTRKELKKIWIRRDLPDTTDEIRIVRIGELDTNACCGVHPKSTLDLRMIKIRKCEKHKGATRIEYLAGKRAIDYALKRDLYLNDICKYLSCGEEEAINGIKNLHDKVEETLTINRKLEEVVANYEIKEMIKNASKVKELSVVIKTYENENLKYVSKVASKISEEDNAVALIGVRNEDKVNLIFACSKGLNKLNMSNILKDSMTLLDGRGGGSPVLAQGGGKNNGNLETALNYAFTKIEKLI